MKKVKSPSKIYNSDLKFLQNKIIKVMNRIAEIVGSSLGPNGRNVLIESELTDIPNKNTKDGVTIFRALGADDPIEHLIIEQTRDVAIRTVNEAGDGTTTSVILASALIKNLFNFCQKNKRYSPQKVTRQINKLLQEVIVPAIAKNSIKVTSKNQELLEKVATISANGDKEMSKAVIEAFETIGYGDSSHVTIEELSGPSNKYEVELIEGFPFNKGYEESIGKFHNVFINDQANRRVLLENPLFILFDGVITDMKTIFPTIERLGEAYVSGESEFNNIVVVAHGFSDPVLTTLSYNFPNPSTINIVPLATPIEGIANSQLNFLMDLSAFTGAKIFGMNEPLSTAKGNDFGYDMERIEIYRFRTTVVGQPDELNIQKRASDLKKQSEQSESKMEKRILTERIGKLTNGIAKLKIYGASNGELKEKSDRAEDAVCAVRAAITNGALPGGCRMLINLTTLLNADPDPVIQDVVIPSLSEPFIVLLDNAGYSEDEIEEILTKLIEDPELVYDVENAKFGTAKELGVYDATMAVEQALKNAVSIASVMGTLGGIICSPRDHQLERKSFLDQQDFDNTLENAQHIKNEANERP